MNRYRLKDIKRIKSISRLNHKNFKIKLLYFKQFYDGRPYENFTKKLVSTKGDMLVRGIG